MSIDMITNCLSLLSYLMSNVIGIINLNCQENFRAHNITNFNSLYNVY